MRAITSLFIALGILASSASVADVRVESQYRKGFKLRRESVELKTRVSDATSLVEFIHVENGVSKSEMRPASALAGLEERILKLAIAPTEKNRACKHRVTVSSHFGSRIYCRSDIRRNYELRAVLSELGLDR